MQDKNHEKVTSGIDLKGYHVETWWKIERPTDPGKSEDVSYYTDEKIARALAESEGARIGRVYVLTKDGKEGFLLGGGVSAAGIEKARAKIIENAKRKTETLTTAEREALGLP